MDKVFYPGARSFDCAPTLEPEIRLFVFTIL